MKSNKSVLHILFVLTLIVLMLLVPASTSHAQETDQGWSKPVNLSMSGGASNPMIVVDSQGVIHAIWVDDVDGYMYSQSDDGSEWSVPVTVKFPFDTKDAPPVLLADEQGLINIFWIKNSNLFYGQTRASEFAYPANWKIITLFVPGVLSFDVTLDSRGALHIAYIRKSSTDVDPAGVYYRQSTINGGTWSTPILLYSSEYFRSIDENDAYIRISTSNFQENERIYITWDNHALKRVFMAVSSDTGITWNEAQEVKGPSAADGSGLPFNLTVAAIENRVLLVWQVGVPGASGCKVYSQWSEDGGETWGDTISLLGGRSECPVAVKVVGRTEKYVSILLIGPLNPILLAWNGERWSERQTQIILPYISNPLTLDTVLLGCRNDLFYQQRLYVVGCDQGTSRDVWFLSRSLDPIENWFSPLPSWNEESILSIKSEVSAQISNFFSVADEDGNVHALWAQSSTEIGSEANMTIEYTRWDGHQWSTPDSIISSLTGMPSHLLATIDPLNRLLLTWVDNHNGDLAFSWANTDKAKLASEWEEAISLPIPSRLVYGSDIIVDGSGRIVVVYVIPINEDRGIYIIQSSDGGRSWSVPIRIFDAITEGWERIDQPKISLDADGVLHLVFVRNTIRVGQSVGLYYMRSLDGGVTWSDARLLSEEKIQWVSMASYEHTVHVVWQEYDGLVFANVSQFSQDNGVTWGKQYNVTGVEDAPTQVFLVSDKHGTLHFVQLVNQNREFADNQRGLILKDWKWDGSGWMVESTKDLLIEEPVTYSLSANITSTGFLDVFVPAVITDASGDKQSEILTFTRYLGDIKNGQSIQVPILSVPSVIPGLDNSIVLEPTVTPDLSILYDDAVTASPLQKNIVGLVLIGIGTIATVVLVLWRRKPVK